jgi:hypothetical protein
MKTLEIYCIFIRDRNAWFKKKKRKEKKEKKRWIGILIVFVPFRMFHSYWNVTIAICRWRPAKNLQGRTQRFFKMGCVSPRFLAIARVLAIWESVRLRESVGWFLATARNVCALSAPLDSSKQFRDKKLSDIVNFLKRLEFWRNIVYQGCVCMGGGYH